MLQVALIDHRAIELTIAAGVCLFAAQGDSSSCYRLLLWQVNLVLLQGLLLCVMALYMLCFKHPKTFFGTSVRNI
jgi:hypothetical protein